MCPTINKQKEDVAEVREPAKCWMTPITKYLEQEILPTNPNEAKRIKRQAPRYVIQTDNMYWQLYLQPLLRCIGPHQADYIIREFHEDACGNHIGARSLSKKILRWRFYWLTLHNDVHLHIQKYPKCQLHAPVPRQPLTELTTIQGV